MGRHVEPRHSRSAGPAHALQNAVLPAVLLLVVGLIAWFSPALRGDDAEPAGSDLAAAATPEAGSEPSATVTQAPERSRPGAQLAFKAGIVRATRFEKLPPIPPRFVRVRKNATLPTSFSMASYNVLGYSHTVRGGNKPGWADGRTRMRWATDQLRARGVSVVGFQEFQIPQATTFAAYAPGFQAYPGAAGGRSAVQNSIAWDTSVWTAIETATTPIPYFRGHRVPMPHVLLEHVVTGQRVWFANYHNPADKYGGSERWRDLATSIEIGLANQLRQDHPVVITGDMNEREEFLCRVAAGADMHSANGGYADAAGCHYPPPPLKVDWIMGTTELDFSGYGVLDSRASDHPLISSDVVIKPAYRAQACETTRASRRQGFLYCPPR